MRVRAKVDVNHKAVVSGLRTFGYRVLSLASIGSGCPDILVGGHGKIALMEVKAQGGKLTEDQEKFIAEWGDLPVFVVRSPEQAIRIMRGM